QAPGRNEKIRRQLRYQILRERRVAQHLPPDRRRRRGDEEPDDQKQKIIRQRPHPAANPEPAQQRGRDRAAAPLDRRKKDVADKEAAEDEEQLDAEDAEQPGESGEVRGERGEAVAE